MVISDIVKNDLCTGCGLCTSENKEKEKFYKMEFNDNGFLVPSIIDNKKIEPLDAVDVCPFANTENNNEDSLAEEFFGNVSYNKRIGRYVKTYVGYSNEYRKSSSSGGVATYFFNELLKRKLVDVVYVVKSSDNGYSYQEYSNLEDITKISKTRYYPVTLEELFDKIDNVNGRIAISGVACFVKAIRLKQKKHPYLKEKIPFLIGIICGGLKSKNYTDFLTFNAGITEEYSKQEYRIKNEDKFASSYSFGAFDQKENVFKQMEMKKVGDMWGSGMFKSLACDFCTDVTTELADISLGDAWLKPYVEDGRGTNIIITRNLIADNIIREGLESGELTVNEVNEDVIIKSQNSSFVHRQMGLKYRLKKSKEQIKLDIPHRKKFLRNIPLEYKFVQDYRSFIRNYSIKLWGEVSDKKAYMTTIKEKQAKLKRTTKLYHRIQRVRKILGMKNLNNDV